MIFCTAFSGGTGVECDTTTRNWKASRLNTVTPIFPERKQSKTRSSAEKRLLSVSWDNRAVIRQQYMVNGTMMDLWALVKTLKKSKNE